LESVSRFSILGQGFYSINIPVSKAKEYSASGILIVLDGDATEGKIDKQLKNLVKEDWDFKVKKIDKAEFLVGFPDKSSLDTFTKLSEFQMSLFGLKGKLEKASRDQETSSVLQTVWIKIHNVPDVAKEVETIKEIVNLVAEPLVVDELSLIRVGPMRFQGRCRNPTAIHGGC
jgi:hypothetical protein